MMTITDPAEARAVIRRGAYTGHTAGVAPDFVQGNVCILPRDDAMEFAAFCQRNPKPCPLIGMGAAGDPALPDLGDIDIRTDVPQYRVFRDGELVEERDDVLELWRDDLVTFILGCSFSFELPLIEEDISLQHVERDTVVPMYRTNIACTPAGKFNSDMVVSMRPLRPADAIRAVQITSRFPGVHGAPVHIGLPEQIGVEDVYKPDFGDPPAMNDDQLAVFWACGVTPQVAVEQAKPSLCITHKPGSMLITDKKNIELAAL
ncbi:MAG: putative hydro-lyase [Hyphomicrobiaceae bacterium]|nr:putative hydro-lyase [Hyphomicrobiaceae bacterium]